MIIKHTVVGPVGTNCYVVIDEKEHKAALIDPGADAPAIRQLIDGTGAQVVYIMLTHGHFDHIYALAEIKRATGARVICHREDVCLLSGSEAGRYKGYMRRPYEDAAADILVDGGESFMIGGIKAEYMHTPGHTPGSCIIKMEKALFTGDTLFRFECGRCDLPGGNFEMMLRSLKRIAEIPGQYAVYPGHEAFSTLDEERAQNPYIKMALEKA